VTTAAPIATCSNPDCRVGETGKCVEGLALDKCPRYGRLPVAEPGAPAPKPEGIPLARGDRLDVSDAPAVLRGRDSRIVAVLGARDSGKTSLVAGLYGLFQDGRVDAFSFAGSCTLRAFEEACHDARSASNRQEPHFERTLRGALGFYHIALRQLELAATVDLLVADRAGEEYLEVADDASTAKSFPEVVHADVVTLLVDGRRLVDISARHNLRSELEMMLQALKDGDALAPTQRLAITLTKLDELERSPEKARAEADFTRLVESVRTLFGASFSTIQPFRIAASPTSEVVVRGFGLRELLAFWMLSPTAQSAAMRPVPAATRSFGRLTPGRR
jgi:hypothetical protein